VADLLGSVAGVLCSGSEAGSYLRLIDSCITQLKAQGPSRTCNESKEEEEEEGCRDHGVADLVGGVAVGHVLRLRSKRNSGYWLPTLEKRFRLLAR